MAWTIQPIMGGHWRAARRAYRRGGSIPDRAAILIPALVAALLAAACGFSAPAASGIDAPTDTASMDAPPPGWLHPWKRRKPIALLASKIEAPSNTELTDFPVLISLTDTGIAASARVDGADIVFTAADGTTLLASEIESFTPLDRKLVAWVKIPTLSATTDTTIYLYYGHSDPATRTPEDVWTASYLGVWHLNKDPDSGNMGAVLDATFGNHDGTANNMASNDLVSSQIGSGFNLDGNNDYLSFAPVSFEDNFTISMWIRFAGGVTSKTLLANSITDPTTGGFHFFVNTAGSTTGDHKLIFETAGTDGAGQTAQTDVNAISTTAFAHVAAVVSRSNRRTLLYVNGASIAATSSTSGTFQTDSDFHIGQMKDGSANFWGILDEIEIATELRSPEWIRTSFNNQSVPGSFYTLSAEESEP